MTVINDYAIEPELLAPFWVSIKLASITTLILLLFGTPLAYWLSQRSRRRWLRPIKSMLLSSLVLPLVLPPTVIGFYLLLAFSPRYGIGDWWQELGLAPLAFGFTGLVIGSIIYSLPFYVQPVYAQFKDISTTMLDAAQLLEHSRWQIFSRVVLPQAKEGIILGALISFAHTIGEFGVVLMIGGSITGQTKVASIAIYEQVEALNYAAAGQMSLVLLGFALVTIVVITLLSNRSLAKNQH